jgi:hypothetical protein
MTSLKKAFFFLILALLSNIMLSQWNKLPTPNLYHPVLYSGGNYFHAPDKITPIGNGKLIFRQNIMQALQVGAITMYINLKAIYILVTA